MNSNLSNLITGQFYLRAQLPGLEARASTRSGFGCALARASRQPCRRAALAAQRLRNRPAPEGREAHRLGAPAVPAPASRVVGSLGATADPRSSERPRPENGATLSAGSAARVDRPEKKLAPWNGVVSAPSRSRPHGAPVVNAPGSSARRREASAHDDVAHQACRRAVHPRQARIAVNRRSRRPEKGRASCARASQAGGTAHRHRVGRLFACALSLGVRMSGTGRTRPLRRGGARRHS